MFKVHFEANTVYAVFQDLSNESRDTSTKISKELEQAHIPLSLHKRIKNFFNDNKQVSDNFNRQKAYISALHVYIDVVNTDKRQDVYYLNLYVLPKDINLKYNNKENAKTLIEKVDKLSLHIYNLYNSIIGNKDTKLKAMQIFKGRTFLDLELSFYLKELNKLHDYLLNYKRGLRDKVICSDKDVGIMIDSLNELEKDPLKQYQFVKVVHQKDLIVFVYSLIIFLEEERIDYFKNNELYGKLKSIFSKINNYLLKISTATHIKKETVTFKSLQKFFNRYKNSQEIQKNMAIYNILETIFSNQLEEGVFISKSIDMTKMFEKVVEEALKRKYGNNLFIGEEPKRITGVKSTEVDELNKINYLLQSKNENEQLDKEHIGQFPDFLIQDSNIYHIVDAKYKLKNYLLKDRSMFWQVLIYSKLFNKSIENQNLIKKIIVFAEYSDIDLDDINKIAINSSEAIDIEKCDWYYNEMIFDSQIGFIGLKTLIN